MNRFSTGILAMMALAGGVLSSNSAHAQAQRIAVPSYVYPGAIWDKIEAAAPTARLTIINPASGPGTKVDPNYLAQVKAAKSHGLVVIAYVHTSYGKRNIAEVKSEIDKYYKWYPVDGIFFDEVASGADELPYYTQCSQYVHSVSSKGLVVLNPGNEIDRGYMAVADIICTFESNYDAYLNKYEAPSWVTDYPARRFWHIVLKVPTDADMQKVMDLGRQRHAGFMYVTELGDPNPYDQLPAYWDSELKAAAK